jgi:phosphatidate cytidylyltransferase
MKKTGPSPSLGRQIPRLATGVLLAAVLVVCLIVGGAYLRTVLALAGALALFEFFQMFWPGKTKIPSKIFGLLAGLLIFCPVGQPMAVSVVLALAFAWAAIAFLAEYGRGSDGARLADQAPLPLGLAYVPILLHLALSLSLREQFLVAAAAVASDTAAYYFGCAFGRHKIWPRVSPNKSWEGGVAGFVASVGVTVAIACAPHGDGPLHGGGIPRWLLIGAVLGVAGQLGDFFESALKRTCGVKDSGALLPGHGGILDRVDSILFCLAAYSAIMLMLRHASGPASLFAA